MPVEKKSHDPLTDYEIVALYVESVQTFANVASKAELEKGVVFDLGKRLFNEAIGTISTTRKKLSE